MNIHIYNKSEDKGRLNKKIYKIKKNVRYVLTSLPLIPTANYSIYLLNPKHANKYFSPPPPGNKFGPPLPLRPWLIQQKQGDKS